MLLGPPPSSTEATNSGAEWEEGAEEDIGGGLASLVVAWCFVALAGLLRAAGLVTREACGLQDRGWRLVAPRTVTTASL